MNIGDKVKVIRTADSFYMKVKWWPVNGMTGTIEAIHKNGSIRIACHQLHNQSDDGLISKTFSKNEVTLESI